MRTFGIVILAMLLLSCSVPKDTTDGTRIDVEVNIMKLSSPAFQHNHAMPAKYTCQGQDISPPLRIEGVSNGTVSLALIMEDPDAPDPAAPKMTWDHWVVWNIPPSGQFPEGSVPAGSVVGANSWPKNVYGGPCPPIGTHRYFFKLYALDTKLNLPPSADKRALLAAMQGHIIGQAELIGLYKKT